ncbi:MAG: hypothetical protein NTZ18_04460 [Candidatus Komeilibacteria bacterium]|nr:hypothetical protein [Candidatus Komeilibacteria bacterium]
MNYKFAQLLINDPHHSLKAGEILIQPTREPGGNDLILLIEIDSNLPADQQFIQYFLELAYGIYEHSALHQTEKILENILAGLNEQLLTFNRNKGYDWLNKMHCLVGLASGQTVHFASFGKINCFLIRPALIKNISTTTYPENKKILFDSSLSGQLKPGDRFFATTEGLLNYLSLEKIKKTLSTLPPLSAIAHLTNILEAAPATASFFSIIVQSLAGTNATSDEETTPLKGKLAIPTGSKNSLDQLLKTQAETERILTPPSFLEIIKAKVKSLKFKTGPAVKKEEQNKTETMLPRRTYAAKTAAAPAKKISRLLPNFSPRQKKILLTIKKIFGFIFKILKNLWLILADQTTRQNLVKKISHWLVNSIAGFNRLSKTKKNVIVGLIVIILLFSQSLIWQGQMVKNAKEAQIYQNTLNQINEIKTSIDASLIYKDTLKAKQLLDQANTLLNQLPRSSKDQLKKYQEISGEIKAVFTKVWKIKEIPEPLVLIDLKQTNPNTEMASLNIKDNLLYAVSSAGQFLTVNLTTDKSSDLSHNDLNIAKTGFSAKTGQLIGVTPDNKFYNLTQSGPQAIPTALPAELKQINGLTFYLDKMYLLDQQANQIFRLSYSGQDLNSPRAWLKESLPVDQTTDLAVDGFVYALQNDGSVLKIAGGRPQDFPRLIIEPQFNNPTKIFTEETGDNLYILDPANKRLVAVNKQTGEIISQYQSEKFDNLKDVVVREKDKKAYLLNGSQILVIAL